MPVPDFFRNKTGRQKNRPVIHRGTIYTAFYIPHTLHNYLVLNTLVTKQTKSSILRHFVADWIEAKKQEGLTLSDLITLAATELTQNWVSSVRLAKVQNSCDSFTSFEDFIAQVRKELYALKLTETVIEKIIEQIKEK